VPTPGDSVSIGDWKVAEDISRWIEIVAIGVITVAVLGAFAVGLRTVALEPTLENVAALGLLVIVRTFLAWSLMVELRGHWPWQDADHESPG